jgi:hypothetical protein
MFRTSIAVLLLAVGTTASAEGFEYDYFDFGWGSIDYDDIGVDGDGFALSGSVVVADNLHIFANYVGADLDFGADATSYGIGLGYNTPVSDKVDFVAGVSYEYVEIGPFDENGYGLSIGLRFAASEELEFNGSLGYVDLGDAGDDTAVGVGFLYDLSDNFAFGLNGSWSDDVSIYGIQGRWYFGL